MFPVGSHSPSLSHMQREEVSGGQRLPGLANILDRSAGYVNSIDPDEASTISSLSHPHRTRQSHPPSLMTSNSQNHSTLSSTSSSSYFPHTPLEPPLPDRSLPLPSLYPQKSSGSSDGQFSSFQPPALSPQSTQSHSQLSPNSKFASNSQVSKPTWMFANILIGTVNYRQDYPITLSMPSIRGLNTPMSQHMDGAERPNTRSRDYRFDSSGEEPLDPVSALLKAGEIVDQKSLEQQRQHGSG
jgi:hypothetical protein